MRRWVKLAGEQFLTSLGLARWGRRAQGDRVAILAYHNVVPDDLAPSGDRSLHLPLTSFQEQLDVLQGHFDIIGLDELHLAGSGRPRAVITFDDAYRGAVTLGLAEIRSRRLPATVFVCPGRLGGEGFWWDRLATGDGLPPDIRARALHEFQGREDLIGEQFPGQSTLNEMLEPATAEELRAALGEGVTLASHTWSHPNLARIGADLRRRELERARQWLLVSGLPGVLPHHLSFPYGLWSEEVRRDAEATGYSWLYRVEGGLTSIRTNGVSHVIPRINVPAGVSVAGFELLIARASFSRRD